MKIFYLKTVKSVFLIFAIIISVNAYGQEKLKIFISVDMEGIGGIGTSKW